MTLPQELRDDEATSGLVGRLALIPSLMVIGHAAICWALRFGYHSELDYGIVAAAGFGLWFLHAPWLVQQAIRRGRPSPPWYAGLGVLTIIVAAATIAACIVLPIGTPTSSSALGTVGLLLLLARSVWAWRGPGLWQLPVMAGFGLLGALAMGCIVWGATYHDPLFIPAIRLGTAHIDTVFHSSVCGMIQTHGVPSVGLDGTPYLPYHWGSHLIFVLMAPVVGMSPLEFFNLAYPVIFVPQLVYALLVFGATRGLCNLGAGRGPLAPRPGWAFYLMLTAGLFGILPAAVSVASKQWWYLAYTSESYCLGLTLAIQGIVAFEEWVRDVHLRASGNGVRWMAACLFFPGVFAALALLKLSVMGLLGAAAGYAWLRLGLWRHIRPTILLAACFLAAVATCPLVVDWTHYAMRVGDNRMLTFVRVTVAEEWQSYFLLLHFLWTWVFLSWMLWRKLVRDPSGSHDDGLPRFFAEEILFVVTLTGALPLLVIGWVSVYFFSNTPYWFAFALMLRGTLWRPAAEEPAMATDRWTRFAAMGGPLALAAIIGLLMTTASNVTHWLRQANRFNAASRGIDDHSTVTRVLRRAGIDGCRSYVEAWEEKIRQKRPRQHALVATLEELGRLPIAEKRRAGLFIPYANRVYWELHPRPEVCGFIGPAVTGIAMINGVPPQIRELGPPFGWGVYGQRALDDAELGNPMTIDAARARAKRFGYEVLYVIEDDEVDGIRLSRFE
jgi:hypothetical protein